MEQHQGEGTVTPLDAELTRAGSSVRSEPNYVVSPRKVATSAVVLAIASVATLAVVASVSNAGELSTIALVLAILAFVIQILVFVVQDRAANETRVRSEQLNAQTRALLAEVRTTAQSTQGLIGQQFNQLLQAFVRGASQTAEETKFDPVTFEQRLLDNVRAAVAPTAAIADAGRVPTARNTRSPSVGGADTDEERQRNARRSAAVRAVQNRRRARVERLRAFPNEVDAQEALETLRRLTPKQGSRLETLAQDEIDSSANGTYVGLRPQDEDEVLERENLVTKARVNTAEGSMVVSRLTDKGVEVGRLLTAIGVIPKWAEATLLQQSPSGPPADDDIPF